MRTHILLLPLALIASTATAQNEAKWLRYPAISPDGSTIAFSYQGDLWRVPATGGNATMLTTSDAYDSSPVWSHDGRWIAFASNRHGNDDVYIMPSTGGAATRLTDHSAADIPSDFTPDDSHVLFNSNRTPDAKDRQFPSGIFPQLYTVPVTGGEAMRLLTTTALDARFSPDGRRLAYTDVKGYENEFRKHHTSSVTRDIWSYDAANRTFTRLSSFQGEDRNPVWSADGSTLYWLSERSGSFNVHKMPASGGEGSAVTTFDKDPVRYLSISNNGLLCFAFRGQLWTLHEGQTPQPLMVTAPVDGRYTAVRTLPVRGDAAEMAPSPDGKEVVFVQRGEVFVTSVKEGTTRRITDTPEQERSASFSPDGRSILYAGERDGSWNIYRTSLDRASEQHFFNATVLKEEAVLATPAEEFQPVWSPDGKEFAYLEERTTVKVFNLASKRSRTVLPGLQNYSYSDGDQYFSWSPDSKWLLVQFLQDKQWITQCGLVDASGDKPVVNLTRSGYDNGRPKWALDGKAMIWFSGRDGYKSQASWGGQADVYALFFTQAAMDTFRLDKEEFDLIKDKEPVKKEGDGGADKNTKDKDKKGKASKPDSLPKPLRFELDDLEDRKVRLTVNSSDLADAILSKDGEKLYYLAAFEKGFDLWETNVRSKETKLLAKMGAENPGTLALDKEGKTLFLLNNGGISTVDLDKGEVKNVGINGEMRLNATAERAYLFEHVWRQVVKKFYRTDLQGTDWAYYKNEYQALLPWINNDFDLADLLSEMLGELNASHTGAGYRGGNDPEGDRTGCLGLFYANDTTAGLTVAEVMDRSPVIKASSKIKAGTVIEKINGQDLRTDRDPAVLLNRTAGRNTLLSLRDPKTGNRWEETVKPISRGEEYELLYHRWTERNRRTVDSLSGGRIGYIHVRGMNVESFKNVYEEALGRYHDKAALVVDTRFNGGGWLHDDLATFLNGKPYIRMEPRGQNLGTEPQFKWQRPSVVLMNECNYSDAHMFPFTYKALGIGKLVGMPVPGTGTAVWWETLQNQVFFGIPEVGMVDNNGQYLENQQLEPDVRQANEPGQLANGTDQQLGAAVRSLLDGLK
jgi:tricorn protease